MRAAREEIKHVVIGMYNLGNTHKHREKEEEQMPYGICVLTSDACNKSVRVWEGSGNIKRIKAGREKHEK